MASLASLSAPADPSAESANSAPSATRRDHLAWFTLSKPLTRQIDGEPCEVTSLGMRAFGMDDLPLLDKFQGSPIRMLKHVVAALSGLEMHELLSLDLADFAPMSEDAAWQVQKALAEMGLTPCDYLSPKARTAHP